MSILHGFSSASYPPVRGRVDSGVPQYDGDVLRQVSVGLTDDRSLVTIEIADLVRVEAELDPIIAMAVAEALIEAAINAWHRPNGPLHKKGSAKG